MDGELAFVGFGEAAQAFVVSLPAAARAYDRKTNVDTTRRAKLDEYRTLGVDGALTNQAAVAGAKLILSLVTADNALAAARETARGISDGAIYFDMNSVSPETKRGAARSFSVAATYVDVAIMAPVLAGRDTPLIVSGDDPEKGVAALSALGFTRVRAVAGGVGAASAIKMIRSVMVKGLEALTAECVLAAEVAGVRDEVIASLDASWPATDWAANTDYNLERMLIHGERRAAEMEEVVKTLDALGTGSAMSRATAERQRGMGDLHIAPPVGLAAKLAALAACRAPIRGRAA